MTNDTDHTGLEQAAKAAVDLDDLTRNHELWIDGTDDEAEIAQEKVMENLPSLIAEVRELRETLDHRDILLEQSAIQFNEMRDQRDALTAQLEEARGALEFYADKQNYIDGPSLSDAVFVPAYPILDDGGDIARKATGESDGN